MTISVGRANGHAQPTFRSSLPYQDAAVDQPLPDGVAVGEPAEQHEVRVRLRDLVSAGPQPGREIVARGAQLVDPGEQRVAVPERRERGGLGHRRQVVREPHDAQRVDDRGVGGEVAESSAGERERLAHRARDEQARVVVEQLERGGRAGAPELGVRLVDHDHAGRHVEHRLHRVQRERRAGGVVRRRQQHDVRLLVADQRDGTVGVDGEVVLPLPGDPAGVGVARVLRVHRVRRRERHRRASGPAERLQHVQHHLVRPVGRPDAVGGEPVAEVRGQGVAQLQRLAVGVPVQGRRRVGDGAGDVVDDVSARVGTGSR